MRKLVSDTVVLPALMLRPPEWLMTPAAVLGLSSPPVIGKATRPPFLAVAGLTGANGHAGPGQGLRQAGIELECG